MSKTITKLLLIVTILCISAKMSSAQEKLWRLTFVSHDTLTASRLDSLSDSTLFVTCNSRVISLPIDSIAVLVGFKEGHFMKGAGIGFLVGAATGAIIGAASYQKPRGAFAIDLGPRAEAEAGGLLGAVGGFFIGGIITGSDSHETYDLRTHRDIKMKRRVLQLAFHNDKTR
jgi:hypothetical protein